MAEDTEMGGEGRSAEDEEALMAEWAAMAEGEAEGGGDAGAGGDGGGDGDAVAAEWEAMLGAEGGEEGEDDGEGGVSTRVLNQDEIDSLLGFDDAHDGDGDRSGIQAILNSALVSY